MLSARISERGQVTIPASIRRKLGLEAEVRLEIEERDGAIILRPIRPLSAAAGVFAHAARGRKTDWETVRRETEARVAAEVGRD